MSDKKGRHLDILKKRQKVNFDEMIRWLPWLLVLSDAQQEDLLAEAEFWKDGSPS